MTAPTNRSEARPGRQRERTRVVVVAEPTLSRRLASTFRTEADLAVVGQTVGADQALKLVAELRPDVVILDLEAVGVDVRRAVGQIMGHTPTPILVLSANGSDGRSGPAIEALMAGAVEAMPTPNEWTPQVEADLSRRVRILRGVTVLRHPRGQRVPGRPIVAPPSASGGRAGRVVGIAASTGGPAALAQVMTGLAGIEAPVLVVQHMHSDFVEGLVSWMARVAPLPVQLAVHGTRLRAGVVYIGPGAVHLTVGPGLRILLDANPVTTHRPSADQLFLSMAEHVGADGIGAVLTGMGEDGALGLLAMRRSGAVTMAQDQATSAVFGMPKAAALAGGATNVLALADIATALVTASRGVRL